MNQLFEIIRDKISEKNGAINFSEFMELALYHSVYGYYNKPYSTPSKNGDYFTNVSVGRLFGYLLALKFGLYQRELESSESSRFINRFDIVEAGAHNGWLAKDILEFYQKYQPELFEKLYYWIIEPSAARVEWQRETLSVFSGKVRWLRGFEAIDNDDTNFKEIKDGFCGVILSNELLDAFPVHIAGWDSRDREWFEYGVSICGDGFKWVRIPISPELLPYIPELTAEQKNAISDGVIIEISPAAINWWRDAASRLRNGRIITFDYGYLQSDIYPIDFKPTLRTYKHHTVSQNVLQNVGEQDITASVNFTKIIEAGTAVGLKTEVFCTQEKFLMDMLTEASWKGIPEWLREDLGQFKTLVSPSDLGRAINVLVQKTIWA